MRHRKNNAKLELTELVDKFYKDLQDMEGNRWDTSSLLKRLEQEMTSFPRSIRAKSCQELAERYPRMRLFELASSNEN